MTCNETLKTIEDYHYGELDDLAAARVASHLRGCKECPAALDALEDEAALYRAYAQSVDQSLEVTSEMWEAVRLRVADSEAARTTSKTPASGLWRSLAVMFAALTPRSAAMRQVAYSAILVVVSVTATLIAVGVFRQQPPSVAEKSDRNPPPRAVQSAKETAGAPAKEDGATANVKPPLPPAPKTIKEGSKYAVVRNVAPPGTNDLTPQQYDLFRAMQKIQRAERDYVDAIKVLSAAVNKRKSTLDPRLVAAFEKNLAIVDRAIAQTRKAYETHPGDPEIAQYMLLAYANKVDLMRELAY